MRLKPARPDLKVRVPGFAGHVPPEGAELPDTEFVRRRVRDGDLVPADAPADAAPQPATTARKKG
jgi:hypothetical protein